MVDEQMTDDSSHYEISLTAGQAFVAFVLLLLSLAASFAFGIVIGRGQGDERLVVRRDPPVIQEGSTAARPAGGAKIVELGVTDPAPAVTPVLREEPAAASSTSPRIDSPPVTTTMGSERPVTSTSDPIVPSPDPASSSSWFAQILSSGDAKAAETLAAKLIDNGFTTAYVERVPAESGGMIHRVRVKYASEAEARGAVDRLRSFTTGEVWVSRLQ
ncbi:MAG TPA: SPOR domain-containing protein [Thermoanaerobaculia bacterium]|nr:SPOR domain-containing protein [Thermoanaerobaculia bacterium]